MKVCDDFSCNVSSFAHNVDQRKALFEKVQRKGERVKSPETMNGDDEMTTTVRKTKAQLIRRIGELEKQLSAVKTTLAPFKTYYFDFVPCGKMQDVYGHPFEDEIRNAVCDQWDGTLYHERNDMDAGFRDGWMIVNLDDTPYGHICAHVSYTDQDGTFVDRFCQVASVEKP